LKCPKCGGWMEHLGWGQGGRWTCKTCGFILPPNIGWIITVSVDDVNYKSSLPRLTDEELDLCFQMETRKTSLQRLRGEKRRREKLLLEVLA